MSISPGDSRRIESVKAAITALRVDEAPLTSAQLYTRLSDVFEDEMSMLRLLGHHWRDVPEVIPIADEGPGFYLSPFGLRCKDKDVPVEQSVSHLKPTPSAEEVKAHYRGWQGRPSFVVVIASRSTGLKVCGDLQKAAANTTERQGFEHQQWWKGIVVVTGRRPTKDDEVFFKWNCIVAGPVPCLVYADGDPEGLAAAHKLMARSEIGPALIHAEWQSHLYHDVVRGRAASGMLQSLYPEMGFRTLDLCQPRMLAEQSDEVRCQLEDWCALDTVSRSHLLGPNREMAEKAAVSPLGETARQLRKAGLLYHLVAFKNVIVPKLQKRIGGLR